MKPTISVIMPVYNGERYLQEAIESVLNQTYRDFELILINDGSTDSSEKIIQSFQDSRIVYLDNGRNLGLSRSFNNGINVSRGDLIARMDADDICMPKRFELQKDYLDKHLEISIIGSSILTINETGESLKLLKRPETHERIKWQSLFSTPLFHPTVMARSEIFKNNLFDEALHNSEDYELWSRLIFTTSARLNNLQEPLLKYRVFPQSFTQKLTLNLKLNSLNTSITNIEHYVLLDDKEKILLTNLRANKLSLSELIRLWNLYNKIRNIFVEKENFKPSLLPQTIFLIKSYLKGFRL